jgi:hypothetical protein
LTTVAAVVFGGVVAAIVSGIYQRSSELRSRMIEAADSFLAVSVPALVDLGQSAGPLLVAAIGGPTFTPPMGAKPADQALRDLQAASRELELCLARVELLFGASSPAADAAREVTNGIRNAANIIEFAKGFPPGVAAQISPVDYYNEEFTRASSGHDLFAKEARADIWRFAPRRLGDLIRRLRRPPSTVRPS